MKQLLTNILKFVLFFGVGFTILYFVFQNTNEAFQEQCVIDGIPTEDCSLIQKIIDDFKSVNIFWILLVFVVYIISNISRAIRWMMLIRPLGYEPKFINAFFTTVIGYLANLGLPRIGEVARAGMMAKYENIAAEKLMGTIVVDRIMDVIFILIVTALSLFLEFDTIWNYFNGNMSIGDRLAGLMSSPIFLGLIAGGILSLIALFIFRKKLQQTAIYNKVANMIKGFGQGLATIAKLESPWLFLFHSIVIWVMYYLMTYFCFFAFAPTAALPAVAALLVFVFGGWGIVIPSPGGMGTYHFLAIAALGFYGIGEAAGFSFANIMYFSIQIFANIVLGVLAIVLLPILNKNYKPNVAEGVNALEENLVK